MKTQNKAQFTLPAHLRVFEGDLYRYDQGGKSVLVRAKYSWHHSRIASVAQLKATLRAGAYAWPGGYPLYFITSDGAALSFETAQKEFRNICSSMREGFRRGGWFIEACEVNWEDSDLTCVHSGKRIESAYAD